MLRGALEDAGNAGIHLPILPASRSLDVARRLIDRYGGSAGPRKPVSALQALLRRLRLVRYDWDKVSASDRLDVVWVLWEGVSPPAEHAPFLAGFLGWVEAPWRRLHAARLAVAWAAAFDPGLASIRTAGAFLARHATRLADPWPRLADTFRIFSVDEGPAALAASFLAGDEPAELFFRRLSLPRGAAEGGLALAALAAAAARVEHDAAGEPRLAARLCAFALQGDALRPDTIVGVAARRAKAVRRAIAEALLLPWSEDAPPAPLKARLQGFLLRYYGDVRVMPAPWEELRKPAASIMRRWLIEQAIMGYGELAARPRSADRALLAEREGFWLANIEQIDGAWLVTPRGLALGADQPAHGSLIGCRPDQVALLIRIGSMTVLESSIAPGESVWRPGNALAPTLYRRDDQPYLATSLTVGADFSSAYRKRSDQSWQERLSAFILRGVA